MSRPGDIEARWRDSQAAAHNVKPLPPQWFDESIPRLQANAQRRGVRQGYKAGTRYGMVLGAVYGLAAAAGAVLAAAAAGWIKVL